MALDISKLKKISSSTLSKLETADKAEGGRRSFNDDRFWKPTFDDSGMSRSVIRILPSIVEGKLPWRTQWSYAIRGPKGWYIETSRRTLNEKDPMAEYISDKWTAAVSESDKDALRKAGLSKARKTQIANILVVFDAQHPENNGKVMLYRFGSKVFDMITNAAKPDPFEPEKPGTNVTDWEEGCNLKLNLYMRDKFPQYDKCVFDAPSSIGDDARIMEIADQMYDLDEFVSAEAVKSYDELKAKVDRVFGAENAGFETAAKPATPVNPVAQSTFTKTQEVVKPVSAPSVDKAPWDVPSTDTEDDFDFESLMKDL